MESLEGLSDEKLLQLRERLQEELARRIDLVEVVLHDRPFTMPEPIREEVRMRYGRMNMAPNDPQYVAAVKAVLARGPVAGVRIEILKIPLGSTFFIYTDNQSHRVEIREAPSLSKEKCLRGCCHSKEIAFDLY